MTAEVATRQRPVNCEPWGDNLSADEEEERGHGAKRANSVDVHVGSRIRMRRMMVGMSQEKLGESMGVTFQQIQKYEKGSNRVGAGRLHKLAQVLTVPIGYFYEDAPIEQGQLQPGFAESGGEGYITEFLGTREGIELNRAFLRITDPKTRRRIVDLVRSIAGETTDD